MPREKVPSYVLDYFATLLTRIGDNPVYVGGVGGGVGASVRVREFSMFADYGKNGKLIGVEILPIGNGVPKPANGRPR